jgi:hypothetical protein
MRQTISFPPLNNADRDYAYFSIYNNIFGVFAIFICDYKLFTVAMFRPAMFCPKMSRCSGGDVSAAMLRRRCFVLFRAGGTLPKFKTFSKNEYFYAKVFLVLKIDWKQI